MLFAPAIRNNSAVLPAAGAIDGALSRFMPDLFSGLQGPFQGMEEDEKSWTLNMDVPGVSREHLSISVEGRLVRVETTSEAKRQFKGLYQLPNEVDAENCEAKLENGVLTLKLAKVEQASTGRKIAVN